MILPSIAVLRTAVSRLLSAVRTRAEAWIPERSERAKQLPPVIVNATVAVVSAHGGAGVSTVERALRRRSGHLAAVADPAAADVVLVVCRGSADSTEQLPGLIDQLELQQLLDGSVLVVIAAGTGPTPRAVRARVRAVRDVFAEVVEVPFVLRWRFEGSAAPTTTQFDRAVERLVGAVRRIATAEPVAVGDGKER